MTHRERAALLAFAKFIFATLMGIACLGAAYIGFHLVAYGS